MTNFNLFGHLWRRFLALACLALSSSALHGQPAVVNLAFVGDTGTGEERQLQVRDQILAAARSAPLESVVLLGDNIYGGDKADNFSEKFLDVYQALFAAEVPFHAALGNHDVEGCRLIEAERLPRDGGAYSVRRNCWAQAQLKLPEFGYTDGQRYYSFASSGDPPLAEVFVLDSNTLQEEPLDRVQLEWLQDALDKSRAVWKFLAMHHPVVTPKGSRIFGFGHQSEETLRDELEKIIVGRIDVVFQGHNHLYARMFPQRGVRYFVSGGGGQRPYRFNPDEQTAPREDRGRFNHFVYVRASSERIQYCAIDSDGAPRDGGWFAKGDAQDTLFPQGECPLLPVDEAAGGGEE